MTARSPIRLAFALPLLVIAFVPPGSAQEDCEDGLEANRVRGDHHGLLAIPESTSTEWQPDAPTLPCTFSELTTLVTADTDAFDRVGAAVSLQADVALVGAPGWGSDSGGAGHLFREVGNQWAEEATVRRFFSPTYLSCEAGTAVALDAGVAVVGDYLSGPFCSGTGVAPAFRYDGSTWVTEFTAWGSNSVFGLGLALRGNHLLIGDTGDSSCFLNVRDPKVVFNFHDETSWRNRQTLSAADTVRHDGFGTSIALSEDGLLAVVGAPKVDLGGLVAAGAAYVFQYDGSQWIETQKLTPSDPEAGAGFGTSVTTAGNTIVVGAARDDGSAADIGSVYVFRWSGIAWLETQNPGSPSATASGLFGASVSLDDGALVVGAPGESLAYLFRDHGDAFRFVHRMKPSADSSTEQAGASVSVSGKRALVGAPSSDFAGMNSGAAYVFEVLDLALSVDRETAQAGETLTFTTCGGLPGTRFFLTPASRTSGVVPGRPVLGAGPGLVGTYNGEGKQALLLVVPPGLAGQSIQLQVQGRHRPGRRGSSNVVSIAIQ